MFSLIVLAREGMDQSCAVAGLGRLAGRERLQLRCFAESGPQDWGK